MKSSKRVKTINEKFDKNKEYSLSDAIKSLKELSAVKFDETLDCAMRLGVDPRHADQMVRGTVSLPNGTGKEVKVLVIAKGAKADEAKEAGADHAGFEEYLEKIKGGWADIDVIIATPDTMADLGKLGRVLGPKGLMPNPKSGTVTNDVAQAVKEVKAGKIEFRVEKAGIVHASLGKLSFSEAANNFIINKIDGEINIPINWQLAGLNNFNGSCWFLKKFTFGEIKTNELVQLRFNGVDYFCDVWLNDITLGGHEGYFQPFGFDIKKQIKLNSENTLIVKVYSPLEEPGTVWPYKKKLIKGIFNHHDCRPGGWSLEDGQDRNTGGIWNDVFIESGTLLVDNVKITPQINWEDNTAEIEINLKCYSNINNDSKFLFEIESPEKEIVTYPETFTLTKGTNKLSTAVKIENPSLWWCNGLGKPNLYRLKISSAELPLVEVDFGIREVYLNDEQQFFLNKKKLFLRGTNIIPAQFLSSFTQKKIDSLVALLKEANVNIVRVHAHVNRKELYDAFDKAGIMVWQDFPLQWTYDESNKFAVNAVSQIKDMVNLLYNNPSVVFWCCHNEPGEQIKSLDPLLYKAVQDEDTTRIIRIASNYEEHPYDGWYWGNKEHFAAAPMGPLVTEFGAQALPEKKSLLKFFTKEEIEKPDWEKWKYHNFQYEQTFNVAGINRGNNIDEFITNSQKYQADLIKTAIDFYRRKKFNGITGVFQFMFIDCWESITWSIVDFFGKKKKGFYALKEAFQPLYISVFLRQKKYFHGSKLQADIWLINDLYKQHDKCSLTISINNKIIGAIENITLGENETRFIDYKSLNITLPNDVKLSSYNICFQLIDNKKKEIISENNMEIEFTAKEF